MANKKSKFYKIVKWSTWCWAILGTAVIIYAYTLLWDFKQYAETYNDINYVHLSWDKPVVEPMDSYHIVVHYCFEGNDCDKLTGTILYQDKTSCMSQKDDIAEEMSDLKGVFAYRCEKFADV